MLDGTWQGIPKLGRPVELGDEGERQLMQRIGEFLAEYNIVTKDFIVREAFDLARTIRPGETKDDVVNRLKHVGGEEWYAS